MDSRRIENPNSLKVKVFIKKNCERGRPGGSMYKFIYAETGVKKKNYEMNFRVASLIIRPLHPLTILTRLIGIL